MKIKKIAESVWTKLVKRPRKFYTLSFALVVSFIVISTLFYINSYKEVRAKKGILAEDQLFPASDEEAYRNLDLRIAAKAHFDSVPLRKINDLGISNGTDSSVISFQVPPDHLTEYGLMTIPATPKPKHGFPVIILCHGYVKPKAYSTYKAYLPDMKEYSQHGFVVIKPDFRGQGLSIHSGSAEGAYYSMAYNTDVMSLIAAVKKTAYLDKTQISLWGHSMGAYIALRAAVLSPEVKDVILLSGPVGSIQDMYRSYVPISDRTNPTAYNIRQSVLLRYGNPLTDLKFWADTSPLSYLDKLNARVQIHVGDLDTVVPPKFSADLNSGLNKAHKPHDYFVYLTGIHVLLNERA